MNSSLGQAPVTSTYLFAAGLTLLSGLLFVSSHGIIRHIGGLAGHLHPFEIAFFSNLFSALFYLPLFFRRGAHVLKTEKLPLHIVRSLFNVTAITAWYTALTLTPLADVIALGLAAPLFVTLGAFFFLGEIFRTRRWIAVLVGIAGALIIIRPGFETSAPAFYSPFFPPFSPQERKYLPNNSLKQTALSRAVPTSRYCKPQSPLFWRYLSGAFPQ